MILLNITNSSELVASKLGKFLENLTPEKIDERIVEEKIIDEMVETLSQEGLKGEIFLAKGIDVKEKKIVITNDFSVDNPKKF